MNTLTIYGVLTPRTFVKSVSSADGLGPWSHPSGAAKRRNFPVTSHPFVAAVSPGPVAWNPHMLA